MWYSCFHLEIELYYKHCTKYPFKAPFTEAAIHRGWYKKVFWKYAANLQENTHAEVRL